MTILNYYWFGLISVKILAYFISESPPSPTRRSETEAASDHDSSSPGLRVDTDSLPHHLHNDLLSPISMSERKEFEDEFGIARANRHKAPKIREPSPKRPRTESVKRD